MKKKILYISIILTAVFVAISLYFSVKHPISIFGTEPTTLELYLYNTFEFIGIQADLLSIITGYPKIIFFSLLSLTLWVIFYLIIRLLFGIINIFKPKPMIYKQS